MVLCSALRRVIRGVEEATTDESVSFFNDSFCDDKLILRAPLHYAWRLVGTLLLRALCASGPAEMTSQRGIFHGVLWPASRLRTSARLPECNDIVSLRPNFSENSHVGAIPQPRVRRVVPLLTPGCLPRNFGEDGADSRSQRHERSLSKKMCAATSTGSSRPASLPSISTRT